MSKDTYTEVTTQSWFSRIRDSLVGVLFGLLIFVGSFLLLWFNEGRTVKTAEALREIAKTVLALPAPEVSPRNEGQLIYVTGTASTGETLRDPSLGISAPAIKLHREVEMYQWVESAKSETREKVGGSKETVTTYTYETQWSGTYQDPARFKKPEGHANPAMLYTNTAITAKTVSLGSFLLSPGLITKINPTEQFALTPEDLAKLPASLRSRAELSGDYLYLGARENPEPNMPRVGDYRIRYRLVPAATALSIIAKQIANTFEPYQSQNGRLTELLETGTISAAAMVANAQKSNQLMTWLLRLLGFILMLAGLVLIFKPLSTIGAFIPVVGRILGAGTGFIAFLLALTFSLVTIAAAWLFYRPVLAVLLLLSATLPLLLLKRKKRPAQTESARMDDNSF